MNDPRGPLRKVTQAVEPTAEYGHWIITLECGHQPSVASHFHYKVGEMMNCCKCGDRPPGGVS